MIVNISLEKCREIQLLRVNRNFVFVDHHTFHVLGVASDRRYIVNAEFYNSWRRRWRISLFCDANISTLRPLLVRENTDELKLPWGALAIAKKKSSARTKSELGGLNAVVNYKSF